MATYFGEVVERSSRAFWGEEFDSEDDIESNSHKNCRWSCYSFCIFVYRYL